MIDPDNLPNPTFVNTVAVSGFLNGNVNLLLSAVRWYPDPADAGKVAADEVASVDLRMDLHCAQNLRDALDVILAQNTKPSVTN